MAKKKNPPHGQVLSPPERDFPPDPRFGFFHPPLKHVLFAGVGRGMATAEQAIAKLGRESATILPDSYGNLTLEQRPKTVALVGWEGGTPTAVQIPIIIGSKRQPHGRDTESNCESLDKLAGRSGNFKPPLILVHAAGAVPRDYTKAPHLRWRIESLDWDPAVESRDSRGRRVYVEGVVVVRADVADETLAGLSPATAQNRANRGPQREGELRGGRYVAKDGDTLRKIAKRFGLTAAELRDMKEATGVRNADQELRAGRVIHLPKRAGTFG